MHQTAIFGPFFTMMILTFVVWVYMYARRIPFIQSSGLTPGQLSPARLAEISPPQVSNPSDNLKNLFELPACILGRDGDPVLVVFDYERGRFDNSAWLAAWWGGIAGVSAAAMSERPR